MKPCCRRCANASRLPKDERSCASASQWNTPWPISDTGKADVPATGGGGRMCLICDDVQSFITYMCSHAQQNQNSRRREYLTDVLGECRHCPTALLTRYIPPLV